MATYSADPRSDPDLILARVKHEQAKAARGKLKIFFGACAGVGKTYAMLSAAHAVHSRQVPVLIGLVETHGRAETEAMLRDLARLPRHAQSYRGRELLEFDLSGALAWGAANPGGLLLLDELAHSNAPGSHHLKRWQDVEELLDHGIDVWSTMNVQHLESLNDIVSGITGIRVNETVPDRIFDDAAEVVVVDLPPDELLARLAAGKVYLAKQAERAAQNFFRKGNLLALRELALRRTADRIDGEMQVFRQQHSVRTIWPARESLLACIGTDLNGEKLVRSTARLAQQLDASWHAVHVETPDLSGRSAGRLQRALRLLKLAGELGATTTTVAAPERASALVRYAKQHNLVRLVLGPSHKRWPWQRSLGERIRALSNEIDLLQIALAQPGVSKAPDVVTTKPFAWPGYVTAVAACVGTAVLSTPLLAVLELSNIIMLFLLTVVGVALRFGRGPAVLAAVLGVGLFDFFFVVPRFSFAVRDVEYLVTFVVMLVVALVIGQLTAKLKAQADTALRREQRVSALYNMSRDLSAALVSEQVAEIATRFLNAEFNSSAVLLSMGETDQLQVVGGAPFEADFALAQWAFDHAEAAGRGTNTLAGSSQLCVPLIAPMRVRGVIALLPSWQGLLSPDQQRLLDTCASLAAISLERIHYIDVAQRSMIHIESERLRNSLLSAISHDLRTPLTALVGLADALSFSQPTPSEPQREIALAMKQSAQRMTSLVNNLLDMARLEAGAVQLHRAWQPFEEVVGSALAYCDALLAQRCVNVQLSDDLPLLYFDAVLMERVLVNLLENAVKYTPANSALTLRAERGARSAVLKLIDAGPGIPEGQSMRLFEKFERGHRESTAPGVGLGLSICRAIVKAHGGRIHAENIKSEGHVMGACFWFELPLGNPPGDDGSERIEQEPLK